MDLHAYIVRQLRWHRDKRGISTYELARRAGIRENYLSKVFNGKRSLKADELVRLCLVLGVSFQQLVPLENKAANEAERNVHGDASRASMASR